MTDSTALVWTKSKHEARAHETTINDMDVRVVGVDDIWFIKTRTNGAPFDHMGGRPTYTQSLRDAKGVVQRLADRIAASVERINAKADAR